jgi:hypothetical protein
VCYVVQAVLVWLGGTCPLGGDIEDSRPDLRPLGRDHGKAGRLIVEAHPGNLLEGIERRREL